MSAINVTVQALLAGVKTAAIVGTRVNPIVAPQTQVMPNIVVNLVGDIDVPELAERSRFAQSRVSIACQAATATDVGRLAEAIKDDLLKRHTVTYAGCSVSFVKEGTDVTDYSDDVSVKRRTLDFYVWWRPAA